MKKIYYIISISAILVFLSACDFLDVDPKGTLSDEQLNTVENVEKMVIAAYASLGNDKYIESNAMWPYGDLRSGDSYKGGGGTGDDQDKHFMETFTYMRDDLGTLDAKWYKQYVYISRCNNALRRLYNISDGEYEKKSVREAELRFLRAHFYFELKILFKHIAYLDEKVPLEDYILVSNVEHTSDQMWAKIVEELRFAVANLPENNEDPGRANRWSAKAYLAKALLYSAYKQDEKHNVIDIDKKMLDEVVTITQEIIGSQRYKLVSDFANNFLCEYKNGTESVFAVQHSHDDGTPFGRLNWSAMTVYPMNSEYGCCGLHSPSQNLVNAFQTDAKGLPKFDNFNDGKILNNQDLLTTNVDPRLVHSVAIPGVPYKYRADFVFQESWARQPETYGAFMSLKEVVLFDCPCFVKVPPFMSSSMNRDIIRYDDVVLWSAEALIELGREAEAMPLINDIRARANTSTDRLIDKNGNKTGKFVVDIYKPGVNCTWTNQFAREALRWERRLEFALEGVRFFDLVRWGIAAEYVNDYFGVEKGRHDYLKDAKFTKNRDEYFPIPKAQINFSKKLYKQNNGWPQ